MGRQHRPTRLFRPALILMAVLCVALATPLMAQQAADSTRAAVTIAAPASTHATTAPAPQASERFGRIGPSATSHHSAAAAAFGGEGGSHTIVISTLALVLIVIIVVLLIR